MERMGVPPVAADIVRTYLESLDGAAPGLVEGLYLIGSVALADYRPGTSDVNFVAVTQRSPDQSTVDIYDRAHEAVRDAHHGPNFDGIYVTWSELAADPRWCAPGPQSYAGHLHPASRAERHPVTWHLLAHHGVAVRGPAPHKLAVWTDPAILAACARDDLYGYWRSWHRRHSRIVAARGLAGLRTSALAEGVLVVSRLHHTAVHGTIVSKGGAAGYALETFDPRWAPIIQESLRIRRDEPPRRGPHLKTSRHTPMRRRAEALGFVAMAIDHLRQALPDEDPPVDSPVVPPTVPEPVADPPEPAPEPAQDTGTPAVPAPRRGTGTESLATQPSR